MAEATGGVGRALLRPILSHVCLHTCMTGTRLAAPLLALSQGYSAAAVGVLLALFAVVQIFLALPAGRYADRHGLKRPVGYSILVACFGAGAALLFPVFPVLCLSALLTGGATGVAMIAVQRHVGRLARTPLELKTSFSWLAIAPSTSNFLGPFCAGLLIDHAGSVPGDTTGYRGAFLLMTVMPLLAWLLVRRVPEQATHGAPADPNAPKAWDMLRDPLFVRLMVINLLLSSCWDVHSFAVPLLGHERGFSATIIGSILGAFAIAATAVRVLIPIVATRIHEWAAITAAMAGTALALAIYPLQNSAIGMGLCSVLMGFTLGMTQPMVMSTLHQITPEARQGEALGLRMMTITVSSVVMPIMFGSLGSLIGIPGLFWIVSGVLVLSLRSGWKLKFGRTH